MSWCNRARSDCTLRKSACKRVSVLYNQISEEDRPIGRKPHRPLFFFSAEIHDVVAGSIGLCSAGSNLLKSLIRTINIVYSSERNIVALTLRWSLLTCVIVPCNWRS